MIKDFCDIHNLITLVWLCFIDNYLLSLITRWLYFSKIWFILKGLMQNQALLDMFHVLRNEGHYFLHIFFRLNLREANFPQYLDHMPRASWYTSSLRYVPHTVKQISTWIRSRWLYFSKIWFILKELTQNQALFDMFHILRNEGHYFPHIYFRLKLKGLKFSTIFGSYAKSFLIHKLFAICSTHSETNIHMNSITMIVFQQNLVHIKRAYAKPSSFWYVPCFTKWRTLFST